MKNIFQELQAKYPAKLLSQAVKRHPELWKEILDYTQSYSDIKTTERIHLWLTQQDPVCANGNKRAFATLATGYRQFCGPKQSCECSRTAQSEKLAANWTTRSTEAKLLAEDRRAATCMERYGVDNAVKNADVKQRYKDTNMEKYGVEYPLQSSAIQDKVKQTLIDRYGVSSPGAIESAHAKRKDTCLTKYGKTHSMDIARAAYTEQTGLATYFASSDNQASARTRFTEIYGHAYPLQVPAIKEQFDQTIMTRHGRDNISKIKWSDRTYNKLETPEELKQLVDQLGIHGAAGDLEISYPIVVDYLVKYGYLEVAVTRTKSLLEESMVLFLDSLGVSYQRNVSGLVDGTRQQVDFYFAQYNLAIEINGLYYHAEHSQGRGRKFHINKTNQLEEKKITLLTIWCDEYLTQRSLVEGKIRTLLGFNPGKIYARKCQIVEPTWADIRSFYSANHMQGPTAYKNTTVALVHSNATVAMLSYLVSGTTMEITRYAGNGAVVMGGFSKLLAHIIKLNPGVTVIGTWADRRWSYGNLYLRSGFVETRRLGADYYYTDYVSRFRKEAYRKEKLVKNFSLDSTLVTAHTEWELVRDQLQLDRVWDCGKIRFELTIVK